MSQLRCVLCGRQLTKILGMRTINTMDAASDALPDLDGLSLAELKAMLIAKDAQLAAKDAQLLSHRAEIEALKLMILKLRRLQFGRRSEKRAQQIEQLELWVEEVEAAEAQMACVVAKQTPAP